MKTPLARGLAIFAVLASASLMLFFIAPPEPTARYDLSKPNFAPYDIQVWLFQVMENRLEATSENYTQRLPEFERFFTQEGYEDYIITLQRAGVIHNLQNNNVKFDTFVREYPVTISQGLREDNSYSWVLDTDIGFNVEFASENNIVTPVSLRVMVSRTAEPNNSTGLRISRIRVIDENVSN